MANDQKIKGNILLLDDEYAICVGVCGLLELNGFKAEYVLTVDEAFEYLDNHPETDVVMLDVNLGPGMNGIEVLPKIKEEYKYIQVVMFTSHDTLSMGLECMKKGAADYLTKPFNEKEFLKKIPEVLAKKNLARLNELYLGILVHDLRNPLQCIIGAWELAKLYIPKPLNTTQHKVVATCDSGILQIMAMLENMLSVSKFEAGTLSVTKENFSVKKVIDDIVEPIREQMQSTERTLLLEFKNNDDYIVHSDKEIFSRVLLNILSNALRYAPFDGSITMTFSDEEPGFFKTMVTNTGSYIEEEHRTMIFDKFSGMHLKKNASGICNYGLGMTFSKMAIESLGGKIWVTGTKDPDTTTFVFIVDNIANEVKKK